MTCRDTLQCVHEPFGDAFYFGPERLSERYEADVEGRAASGFEDSTYRTIFERIDCENTEVGSLPPTCRSCSLSPLFASFQPIPKPKKPKKDQEKTRKHNYFLITFLSSFSLHALRARTCLNGTRR